MQRASTADSRLIRSAIETGNTDQLDAVVRIVRETGALDVARALAAAEAERAMTAIATFARNEHQASLLQLAAQLLGRRM
jgi:octaprenyl-diphosphate synthase